MITPVLAALGIGTIGLGSSELVVILVIAAFLLIPFALLPAILSFLLLNRIPAEHRKQEPGLAFLLIIPLFSIIWAFFVYPRISDSLRSYFASRGQDRADCGRGIAIATCVCIACSIIPIVGMLSGLAGLVLLIVFFVKAFGLTGEIQKSLSTGTASIAPPPVAQ